MLHIKMHYKETIHCQFNRLSSYKYQHVHDKRLEWIFFFFALVQYIFGCCELEMFRLMTHYEYMRVILSLVRPPLKSGTRLRLNIN